MIDLNFIIVVIDYDSLSALPGWLFNCGSHSNFLSFPGARKCNRFMNLYEWGKKYNTFVNKKSIDLFNVLEWNCDNFFNW